MAAAVFAFNQAGVFRSSSAAAGTYAGAQKLFGRVAVMPVSDLRSAEAVRTIIARFDVPEPSPRGSGSAEQVAEIVAELLYHRFGSSSPARYIEWRRSRGYRLKNMEEMLRHDVDDDYPTIVGRPFPEGESVDALFATYWDATLDYGDGFNRPLGIANEPKGLQIVFGTLRQIGDARPMLDGELSSDAWHGQSGGAMRMWFAPQRTLDQIIAEEGQVEIANAGVVLAYRDGSRRPLVLTLSWNRRASRWEIQAAVVYNFPSGSPLSGMEL